MEPKIGSAESIFGWSQSYLSLGKWPDRIREAVSGPNRKRDELEFYMCFFVQAYSLRDWMIKHNVIGKTEIDALIGDHFEMGLCRDICNRYKHLNISSPSVDDRWSVRRCYSFGKSGDEYVWAVIAGNRITNLWDLMIQCISFWEALVAAYGLEVNKEPYLR